MKRDGKVGEKIKETRKLIALQGTERGQKEAEEAQMGRRRGERKKHATALPYRIKR